MLAAPIAAAQTAAGVTVQGLFETPVIEAAALRSSQGADLRVGVRITNRTRGPLRFATFAAVLPELIDASGRTVAFAGGSNMAAPPAPGAAQLTPPGQSRTIRLSARLRLRDNELDWVDDTGLTGFWRVSQRDAPYRMRLRYTSFGALGEAAWRGQATSQAVSLPLNLAGHDRDH